MRFVDVVPRSGWDADPFRGDPTVIDHPGNLVVAHHTDGAEPDGPEGPLAIQRFHQGTRDWFDIGYHYVIDRRGVVYVGRELGWRGAHASGANDEVGVALIGRFSIEEPTAEQLESFARLVASLRAEGVLSTVRIVGHGEVAASSCPERLDEHLDEIEDRALDLLEHGDDGDEGDEVALTDEDVERIAEATAERILSYRREGERDVMSLIASGGLRFDELDDPHEHDHAVVLNELREREG